MYLSNVIADILRDLPAVDASPADIHKLIGLIDLTSLNDTDTNASIAAFCEKAQTSFGHVAAVCVYPQFVRLCAAQFAGTPVRTATVVNFPEGRDDLDSVLLATGRALDDGAQEIDVVFPYSRFLAGDKDFAHIFVESCKAACGDNVQLKVILETGAMPDVESIAEASRVALIAGADFIKTSTGKIPAGASLEAAAAMLLVIRELTPQLKRRSGIKVSGGIREIPQAAAYVELAEKIMGKDWVAPETFRIGASRLVDEMRKEVEK